MDVHNTSGLIAIISYEMPIDVTVTLMEGTMVKNAAIAGMTNTLNLAGLVFLRSSGQRSKNLSSKLLKYRITNLPYIKLVCCLADKTLDAHIEQSPIHIQFCLRLPQSLYDESTGHITPLKSPILRIKSHSLSFPNRTVLFN